MKNFQQTPKQKERIVRAMLAKDKGRLAHSAPKFTAEHQVTYSRRWFYNYGNPKITNTVHRTEKRL